MLTLDDDPERTVTIPLSWSNEDGASDSDHNGVPTDVTFNAGETEKSFEFSAVSDRIGDQGETVSIKLGAPPSGVTKGATSETVVTIEDVAPLGSTTVSFGADTYGVSEGSFTTITVVMSHAPGSDATIPIMATNQGDTSNSDYLLSATSVIFGPTDTSKTFTFTATQDSVDDDGESVDLGFGTLPGGVSAGLVPKTTVSITDDDVPAVEVSFEHSSYSVAESDDTSTADKRENEVTVTVTLDAEPERTVDITLIPTNQGASDADYSISATSLTFGPTETEQTFTFTAEHDSEDDDDESVELSFGALPDRVNAGTTHETVVSINDDDDPVVTVNFEHSTYSVAESDDASTTSEKENEVTVTVTLDDEPERTVDITLILTNQGASDADYSISATSVTFGPTETEQTFTFTATQDTVDDDGESVKLTFDSQLPAGVSRGSVPETTVSITDDDAPSSLTVNFKKSGYTVTEGSIEEIVLTLDDDPERTVTIPLSWSNEDGASDSDHNGVPTDVTFNAGETEKSFEFSAVSDRIDDQGETVSIKLGAPPSGVTKGATSETVVTIEDVAPLGSTTVSFGADTYGVSEGSFTTITVVMSHAPGSDATIPIMATNQGDTSNSDYLLSATSVIFGPTDTSKTFTFTATQDSVDDDGESVDLGFGTLPGGVSAGLVPKTTVSITDDDVPAVEVSFEHSSYSVAESDDTSTADKRENEVTVTVTLDAEPERTVDITLIPTNQGASDADYSISATSLTFGPTETEQTFTFTATQDTVDDDGESVKLTFDSQLPAGVSRGSVPETTVSITDDDAPSSLTVNFKKSGYTVTEGGIEEIVLTLDDDPERTVTIPLSWSNEDGASDSDHNGVPTDVTFNAGETEKSFEFSAVSDRIDDQGETVSIKLGAPPSGVTKGATSETVVTIEDVAPLGSTTVSFGADTYGVSEGSFTTITVVMSHAPGSDATIPIMATNQGDTSNSDYLLSATSVIFGPTDTSKTFTFTATQDSVDDDGESVDLGFGTLPGGVSAGLVPKTTVSITDDDVPAVEVSFEHSSYSVAESDDTSTADKRENEVTVTVTLDAEPERTVDITLVPTNQGASDADYSISATSLTFGPTETEQTFTFTAEHDSEDDDDESVELSFGALPDRVNAGTTHETVVSINDDDDPVVTVNFEHSTYSVAESDDASTTSEKENEVTVTVTLDAEPERTVDITLIPTNQGASDADYSISATSVTFGPTETEQTFTFTATQDTVDDDGESVKLTFDSQLPAGVSRGSVPETTVSITDDDAPSSLTVNFKKSGYTVTEGSIEEIVLTLDDDPERTVTIPLSWSNEDGASDSDHNGVPTDVTFNAGETEKSFEFSAVSDRIDDQGETVSIKLGAPPSGVTKGATSETVVTIEDVAPLGSTTVSFGADTYGVSEGSFTTITVVMSHAPGSDATIPIMATNQGDTSNSDYLLSATSVIFGPTDTSKTFTFTATQDSVDDDGESVDLGFGTLPGGVSAGLVPKTTVSITDDDVPAVEVSFEHSSYSVAESDDASTTSEKENEVTVTVTLDAEPERTVDITLIPTNQGASDADYSISATSVTFGPTETEQTFTFTATQDTVDDDGESVKLTFDSQLPAGVSRGSVPETTVSITDDDAPSSLTVNFKKSGYTVTEGSIEEIVLTLDDDPERTVTIPLSWSNEDGASDSDHNGVPTDVTFNAGETEKSFEFSAVSDRIDDQGETVSIKLGAPPSGVTKGATSETVVTIEDVAPLGSTTVSFGADTYGVSEGSFTTITVVMSHAPGSDATIPIMATNQGDTSNSDYLLSATSVIFGPTDTSKTFTFTATQDSVDDDGESVDLGFGTLPGGVSAGLVPKTTVSITDDDVPAVEVSFEHSSYTVAESDDETTSEKENEVTVTVTLDAEPERTVDITLGGRTRGRRTPTTPYRRPASPSVPRRRSRPSPSRRPRTAWTTTGRAWTLELRGHPARGRDLAGTHAEAIVSITDDDDAGGGGELRALKLQRGGGDDDHDGGRGDGEVTLTPFRSATVRSADREDEPG